MSGPQGGKIGAAPLSGASRPSSGTGVKKLVVKNLSGMGPRLIKFVCVVFSLAMLFGWIGIVLLDWYFIV
jgi:hypothetical protein